MTNHRLDSSVPALVVTETSSESEPKRVGLTQKSMPPARAPPEPGKPLVQPSTPGHVSSKRISSSRPQPRVATKPVAEKRDDYGRARASSIPAMPFHHRVVIMIFFLYFL